MKTSTVAGSFLACLALIGSPLQSQQVSGEVVLRSGSVAGRVIVGEQYSSYRRPVYAYRRPPARRVMVQRYAPRVILVERFRHGAKHWRSSGYHQVVVYYLDGRYYDRFDSRSPGAQEIVVYERDGRFYRD
jgi:hypothetical protein